MFSAFKSRFPHQVATLSSS